MPPVRVTTTDQSGGIFMGGKKGKRSPEVLLNMICGRLHINIEQYNQHIQRNESRCSKCTQWKDSGDFISIAHRSPAWISGICKKCNIKCVQKYKGENREKVNKNAHDKYFSDIENSRRRARERQEKYSKNNPDKCSLKELRRRIADEAIDFDENQLRELRLHYVIDGKCMRCNEIKTLQIDHIIPVAVGGKTMLDNLQFLCQTCNLRKHTKTIDYRPDGGEFARQLKEQQ